MNANRTMAGCAAGLALGLVCAPVPAFANAQSGQESAPAPEPTKPQIVAPPATFSILAIDVVGVTRIPAGEIERAVYPFMGPDKSPADVEAARKAVQDAYTKAGFEATVVEVPPQPQEDFAAGVVQIKVAEAPVANVKVSGAEHHSGAMVRRQLPSVRPGEPLNFQDLQRELEAANRFPDREIVPSFDAGGQPGTIDVDLKVRDSYPLHVAFELNNDNSPNTTDLRLTGSVRHTNLWGAGHTLSLGFAVAPERQSDSEAYFGSYTLPFLGSPWTLLLSGYRSNSDIAALGGTNVLGNGYQVGLAAVYRVPSKRDYHAFRIGIDYKDFKQDIGLRGVTVTNAPIRYVPLTLGYNYSASRQDFSVDVGLSSTLGLRVMKRIDCFDPTAPVCRPEDQFTNREVDSVENFAHVNLDATYTQVIPGDWVAVVRLSGQYADSHLVSNEQFAIGGMTTVRGYFQSEVVGDRGLNFSFELRGPSFATQIGKFVDEFRLFAFLDGGIVSVIDPLPDTQSVYKIASYGAGLRLKLFGTFTGNALIGVPLRSTTDSSRNDPRFTFLVRGEF